jgi:hypothetical protein
MMPITLRANAPASKVTASAVERFTLMDNVRGMNILSNVKEWISTEPVLTTSAQGVIESAGNPVSSSEPGTQTVAVLCENTGFIDTVNVTESAKVMLIGSSSMFSEALLQTYGSNVYNFAIFFYGIQWMSNTNELDDLMIEAKEPVSYNFTAGTQGGYNFSGHPDLYHPAGTHADCRAAGLPQAQTSLMPAKRRPSR